MDNVSIATSGSVALASSSTTDSPYILDHGCITYNGTVILTFPSGLFGPIISYHDQINIVKAMNAAYKEGYHIGFVSPKYL